MTKPESPTTRLLKTSLTDHRDLDALVAKARASFDALSPAQQAAHRRDQAISWVYGEMRLAGHENVTKAEIADIVDRVRREDA